jgi:MEMO1 family protein
MAETLPRLRTNLDFMPSPVKDRPGLLIRDSYRYSDSTLIVPPVLVRCLALFDGLHTDLDLRQTLFDLTGDLRVGDVGRNLVESLGAAGFLEDERYARLKDERQTAFREAPKREPVHSGTAYPEDTAGLQGVLAGYLRDGKGPSPDPSLAAIAAPHVSPEGGWQCYQAAYRLLGPQYRDRTFVILGTSHYGEPERFGLTRKPFVTPLGEAITDVALVDALEREAGPAVNMEDYCHAIEHSIEFQVLFLQHIYGPDIRILPVLCGPYGHSLYEGGKPEEDEKVRRFLGALGEMAAREGNRLFWILGVDLAHMGRRYGDQFAASADEGEMAMVTVRDKSRIERVTESDAEGFWDLVQEHHDDLKWCGSAPIYTFLKAVRPVRGRLESYQQWNIDEQSVVSFGALSFCAQT